MTEVLKISSDSKDDFYFIADDMIKYFKLRFSKTKPRAAYMAHFKAHFVE